MTDTIDMAEKFHKTVYANGDMDVSGGRVTVRTTGPMTVIERMPTRSYPDCVMAVMSRDTAIELRDALTVLLAATGGDS